MGRKRLEADGDGDSLLFNAELAIGEISSILRDSDLKRSNALPVEEALALSLKGVDSVSSRVFLCLIYLGFELCVDFMLGIGRWLPT